MKSALRFRGAIKGPKAALSPGCILAHETPGNTLLDPKHHVDDPGLVKFAQKYSLNRLIAPYGRFESILPEIPQYTP